MNWFQINNVNKYIFLTIFILILVIIIISEILNSGFWIGIASIGNIIAIIIIAATKGETFYIILSLILFVIIDLIAYFIFWFFFREYFYNRKKANKNLAIKNLLFIEKTKLIEDSYEENENEKYGKIIFDDKIFLTISVKGEGLIKKGEIVQVKHVKGNILYVERIQKNKGE
ncbi:NfeD family protein [Mesomycoplasma neurolyticum]|uniref:NfeD-like C-terminal, partner-binding n=1 Tax=Mesomycoplasma neurolyticum TaxID=2120 RepID=A0A449A4U0_9BACT|nr:hypothetical protein [Mesomycoplasma neurolyticum]VEU59258.1 Uncharacterised protein [Mesomycoplasma neurolyticum]